MAVFSKYASVLEADGTPKSVHTAVQLINRFLAEDARAHNEVVTSWSDIESAAAKEPPATQRTLFE